ncbi:c-type cytochrome biogenesis protein CcsB [Corynebacterium caspium]|uniref:c-type cytochrome biogenesis protein CcsB n=1 Tax=Corynebacterium caspium TaxID=234828 RepID=UPI0003641FD1|nr:c-type cytochrome biogenesis protein CcsB [Corynebacterium caspium]WKD59892.1 Cytochrome c biogenesis protein CcsA [Corynebacterium caspium DSM 44850]
MVNQNWATISDMSFRGAFLVLLVALAISLVAYGKQQAIIRDAPQAAQDPTKLTGATQSLAWLGIILLVATFITRGLSAGRFPLGNLYEYGVGISAVTMIVAGIVLDRRQKRIMWPWVLVPILVLMFFAGTKLYAESAPVVPALRSYWLPVHVSTVATGASIGIVSGVFSLLYLLRLYQPKGKESGLFAVLARPLPEADKLDQIAYRLGVLTLPVLGLGIIVGAIWAEAAWGRAWGWDPKETVSFISWVLYAAYLHARATPSWRVKAPFINVLAMATMLFNLFFINMVVSGLHSYAGLN